MSRWGAGRCEKPRGVGGTEGGISGVRLWDCIVLMLVSVWAPDEISPRRNLHIRSRIRLLSLRKRTLAVPASKSELYHTYLHIRIFDTRYFAHQGSRQAGGRLQTLCFMSLLITEVCLWYFMGSPPGDARFVDGSSEGCNHRCSAVADKPGVMRARG